MGVASLALEHGGDEDIAIAALLHDVVEDCGGAPMSKEVKRRFGSRVAKIVDGCTDSDKDPKPPWRERKETYLQHLKSADAETRLVSAADKLNNIRSILSSSSGASRSGWFASLSLEYWNLRLLPKGNVLIVPGNKTIWRA
jgi:GTP pyrophosphokinase